MVEKSWFVAKFKIHKVLYMSIFNLFWHGQRLNMNYFNIILRFSSVNFFFLFSYIDFHIYIFP